MGTVTGVAGFGLFVILDGLHVEGLAHVSTLGQDYFHFDPSRQVLHGERSGEVFGVGDRLRVKVARVDLDERKVDFERVGGSAREPRPRQSRGGRRADGQKEGRKEGRKQGGDRARSRGRRK
jgi:ribonuclease R